MPKKSVKKNSNGIFRRGETRATQVSFRNGRATKKVVTLRPDPPVGEKNESTSNAEVDTNFQIADPDEVFNNEKISNQKSKYDEARERRANNWATLNPLLYETYLDGLFPTSDCIVCSAESKIMCPDCTYGSMFCEKCFEQTHRNLPFHIPLVWQGHCFVDGTFVKSPLTRKDDHSCDSSYVKTVFAFDDRGREHNIPIKFCTCEQETQTLIRHRLWPGSPVLTNTAFSFDLLDLIRCWRIQCQASLYSICETLKLVHQQGPFCQQNIDLYNILVESFQQYVAFQSNMKKLSKSHMECPACPKDMKQTPTIVAVDACFGLVRKKSSGTQISAPSFGMQWFVDQNDVDNFMETYATSAPKSKVDCNDFQASSLLKGNDRTKKLDEKAVFGAVCRHDIPLCFYNIKHDGEKIGYVVFMLEKLKEQFGDQQIVLMYDIACQLYSHLKNSNTKSHLLENTTLTVPAFHAYGHTSKCQRQFASRLMKGTGLADGENMERLWAYLRKFSCITKMMTPNNRTDLLNEALEYYASKSRANLGKRLVQKMNNAITVHHEANEQLTQMGQLENVEVDVPLLRTKYLSNEAKSEFGMNKQLRMNDAYIMSVFKYYDLREKLKLTFNEDQKDLLHAEIDKIVNSLEKIEKRTKTLRPKKNSKEYMERLAKEVQHLRCEAALTLRQLSGENKHLLSLIGQSRGQAVYQKINKTISRNQKQMRKKLDGYNDLPKCKVSAGDPPHMLTYEEVKNQKLAFWQTLGNANEPKGLEMEMVELIAKIDHSKDEMDYIKNDMYQHTQSCLCQYGRLHDCIIEGGRETVILKKHAAYLELEINHLLEIYRPFIDVELDFQADYCKMLGLLNHAQSSKWLDQDFSGGESESDCDHEVE